MADKDDTAREFDDNKIEIVGVIQSGVGQGAYFTTVDWVVAQCKTRLGYEPFPGTLNVSVRSRDVKRLDHLYQKTDFKLVPDDPNFCAARVTKIMLNGIPAALVLPSEDVRVHENRVVEIISSCRLKEALDAADGDEVTISWPLLETSKDK